MKTAISIWEEEIFFAPQDFIIAGAGLVGLWSALEIKNKNPKAKVTIIERGSIPTGASTRNAGFACYGSPSEMLHDAALMGEDKMWKMVEMRYKGISKIRKQFKDKPISYNDCGGYECFRDDIDDVEEIAASLHWLNKGLKSITGEKNSFTFCNKKLIKYNFSGFDSMIENRHEGGLHSGKLVQTLIKKVQSVGVQILFGIELTGWKDEGNKISIQSIKHSFVANKLIICTNALSAKLMPEFNLKPARGQVLVTSPIKGLKMKGTFHYDQGFYYFRNLGKRVLIGGARNTAFEQEETTDLVVTDNIQYKLEQFLAEHILKGASYSITHRWSGIMGLTQTKLPVVEQIGKNIIATIACNGMGVALSPVIAEKVADLAHS
jgi:glycine/D-amino acid oxidase-like deaminating enzyme